MRVALAGLYCRRRLQDSAEQLWCAQGRACKVLHLRDVCFGQRIAQAGLHPSRSQARGVQCIAQRDPESSTDLPVVSQNFLIDSTGHIKLTDFGLAAGALNPGKIENLKHKVSKCQSLKAGTSGLIVQTAARRRQRFCSCLPFNHGDEVYLQIDQDGGSSLC